MKKVILLTLLVGASLALVGYNQQMPSQNISKTSPLIQTNCPEEVNELFSTYYEKIFDCAYQEKSIDGEKILLWEAESLRNVDWGLQQIETLAFIERGQKTKNFFILPERKFRAELENGILESSIRVNNDGKSIEWSCISDKHGDPYLRIDSPQKYDVSYKKINNELFLSLKIDYALSNGCLLQGEGLMGITVEKDTGNFTAKSVPTLSLESCNFLKQPKQDECKCVFAIYKNGGAFGTYREDALAMTAGIKDFSLKEQCQAVINNKADGMERNVKSKPIPTKFKKMYDDILPILLSAYMESLGLK